MKEPLQENESADLESGLRVENYGDDLYQVWDTHRPPYMVDRQSIKEIAELAGYEVIDNE